MEQLTNNKIGKDLISIIANGEYVCEFQSC